MERVKKKYWPEEVRQRVFSFNLVMKPPRAQSPLAQIFVLRLIVHTGTKQQLAECEAFTEDFFSSSGHFSHVLLALLCVLSPLGSRIHAEPRKWPFYFFACF